MARFDIYAAIAGDGYVLDVQSDLLEPLNTRVVVPLLPKSKAPRPADRLNPVFHINQAEHVMVTQFLAAVPLKLLSHPVDNLSQHNEDIMAAIDMLTHGF